MEVWIGKMRSLLARTSSPLAWARLMAWVVNMDAADLERLMPYLNQGLASWPDALRVTTDAAMRRYRKRDEVLPLTLCRSIGSGPMTAFEEILLDPKTGPWTHVTFRERHLHTEWLLDVLSKPQLRSVRLENVSWDWWQGQDLVWDPSRAHVRELDAIRVGPHGPLDGLALLARLFGPELASLTFAPREPGHITTEAWSSLPKLRHLALHDATLTPSLGQVMSRLETLRLVAPSDYHEVLPGLLAHASDALTTLEVRLPIGCEHQLAEVLRPSLRHLHLDTWRQRVVATDALLTPAATDLETLTLRAAPSATLGDHLAALGSLTSFTLLTAHAPEAMYPEPLLDADWGDALTSLGLCGSCVVRDEDLEALARWLTRHPGLRSLRLEVEPAGTTATGWEALADALATHDLRDLTLTMSWKYLEVVYGLASLFEHPTVGRLTRLEVSAPEGLWVEYLLENPSIVDLETLVLRLDRRAQHDFGPLLREVRRRQRPAPMFLEVTLP